MLIVRWPIFGLERRRRVVMRCAEKAHHYRRRISVSNNEADPVLPFWAKDPGPAIALGKIVAIGLTASV
jgi:hypothetical protein